MSIVIVLLIANSGRIPNFKLGILVYKPTPELPQYMAGLCQTYKLPIDLLRRLRFIESNNNDTRIGNAGEIGSFQIKIRTARIYDPDVTVEKLKNPYYASEIAARYLHDLKREFRTIPATLTAYNMGPTRCRQDSIYESEYSRKVLR